MLAWPLFTTIDGARCNILVYAALLIQGRKAEAIETASVVYLLLARLSGLSLPALYQQRRMHQDIAAGPKRQRGSASGS